MHIITPTSHLWTWEKREVPPLSPGDLGEGGCVVCIITGGYPPGWVTERVAQNAAGGGLHTMNVR